MGRRTQQDAVDHDWEQNSLLLAQRGVGEVEKLGLSPEQLAAATHWVSQISRMRRFLTGAKFDLETACKTLVQCLQMRTKEGLWLGVAELEARFGELEPELRQGKMVVRGVTADGEPIIMQRTRCADLGGTSDDERVRSSALALDLLELRLDSGEFPASGGRWVMVLDQRGKPRNGKTSLKFLNRVVRLLVWSYPERMSLCLLLDASTFISLAFRAIKPFLSAKTIAKVRVTSRRAAEADVPDLTTRAAPDQISREYGGTDDYVWQPGEWVEGVCGWDKGSGMRALRAVVDGHGAHERINAGGAFSQQQLSGRADSSYHADVRKKKSQPPRASE